MTVVPITGVRNQMNKVFQKLSQDEELLRLLHYPEELDPLSTTLPDIIGSENEWDVIEKHIFFAEKDSDLTDEPLCRIYITTGRRRPVFGNTFVSTQDFFINVIVHEKFVGNMYLERISDRVNQLLLYNHISGFGKITYKGGDTYQAPRQFQTYLHIYSYLDRSKKLCQ